MPGALVTANTAASWGKVAKTMGFAAIFVEALAETEGLSRKELEKRTPWMSEFPLTL